MRKKDFLLPYYPDIAVNQYKERKYWEILLVFRKMLFLCYPYASPCSIAKYYSAVKKSTTRKQQCTDDNLKAFRPQIPLGLLSQHNLSPMTTLTICCVSPLNVSDLLCPHTGDDGLFAHMGNDCILRLGFWMGHVAVWLCAQ